MSKKEEIIDHNPTIETTMEAIIEAVGICYETKENQVIELELGGTEYGDKVVIDINYVKFKNTDNKDRVLN